MGLEQFIEYIQLFSSFLVSLTGALLAIGAFVKPIRRWMVKLLNRGRDNERIEASIGQVNSRLDTYNTMFEAERAEQSLMKEAYICLTRNALTEIWHRADEQGYISDWDRENFERMYAAYSALGGNSYIHEVHKRILSMPSTPKKKRKAPAKKTKR